MIPYSPPLADMRFALDELALLPEIARLPGCEQASADLVDAVLEEASKLARDADRPKHLAARRSLNLSAEHANTPWAWRSRRAGR